MIRKNYTKKSMKKDIFDLLKCLEKKSKKINSLFGCDDFLDKEISSVWDIIDNEYNITGMNTDESAYILSRFGDGEISKSKAKDLLSKINI